MQHVAHVDREQRAVVPDLRTNRRLYVHVPDHTGAFGPNLSPGESGITSDLGQRRGADVYYWEARTILRSQIRKESTHARETS